MGSHLWDRLCSRKKIDAYADLSVFLLDWNDTGMTFSLYSVVHIHNKPVSQWAFTLYELLFHKQPYYYSWLSLFSLLLGLRASLTGSCYCQLHLSSRDAVVRPHRYNRWVRQISTHWFISECRDKRHRISPLAQNQIFYFNKAGFISQWMTSRLARES